MKFFMIPVLFASLSFSWSVFAITSEVTVDFSKPVPFVPPPGPLYSDSILVDENHRMDLTCYQATATTPFVLLPQCLIINGALSMFDATWAPMSTISGSLSFTPQATSLSFVVSGTVGPGSIYENNLLTVSVVLNSSTILTYNFSNPPAKFNYPITIEKPEGIKVAGISVNYNRTIGGVPGSPDYYYHTGISTITWATETKIKAELIAEVIKGKNSIENNVFLSEVEPSIVTCKTDKSPSTKIASKRTIRIICRDSVTKEPLKGCYYYQAKLSPGPYDGAHTKPHTSSRPLGELNPSLPDGRILEIPLTGLNIEMEMPQVAGEVDYTFSGYSPDFTRLNPHLIRFQIKSPGFVSLDNEDLNFDVYGSHNSHAFGSYGTEEMRQMLATVIEAYKEKAQIEGISNPPMLESEAASLPWGGVYDIKLNWQTSHCGHRDGKTLDLSLSIFNNYNSVTKEALIKALKTAIDESSFRFTYVKESPALSSADHWHIQIKK